MPVGDAPHREIERDPGPEVRHELCRLAAEDSSWLDVSRIEVDRDGPSYTVDTLRALRDEDPERELIFVMGGDQAAKLPTWRDPEQVLSLATIAIAERDTGRREDVTAAIADLSGSESVRFFAMPGIDVSSTIVRARAAAGRPIEYLVPRRVAGYIERAGLYREGT